MSVYFDRPMQFPSPWPPAVSIPPKITLPDNALKDWSSVALKNERSIESATMLLLEAGWTMQEIMSVIKML